MFIFIYFCVIFFTVIQSACTKLYNQKYDNSYVFNGIKSLVALCIFAVIMINRMSFHFPTMLYGMLYGLLLSVSMYSGYKALYLGPMSLTSLLVSFSVLIPIIYGILFCSEAMTVYKGAGIIFLILTIIFVNIGNMNISAAKDKKWMFFVLMTFLANGICSVLQKMHQTSFPGMYCSEFMFFAMILSACIFVLIMIMKTDYKTFKTLPGKKYAAVAGVANVAANYFTLSISGLENASVLYPAISAGTILLTLICGMSVFKERLKYNHFIALVFGIISIVLLKI